MKLIVRPLLGPLTMEIVQKDKKLAKVIDSRDAGYDFELDSDLFDHFLNVTKEETMMFMRPSMEFDKYDHEQATHFRVYALGPSSIIVKETEKDRKLNLEEVRNTPYIITGKKNRIRLVKNLRFSRVAIRDKVIGAVENLEEFIISADLNRIFIEAGLTGFEAITIYKTEDHSAYGNYFQLFIKNILPEACPDLSWKFGGNYEGFDLYRVRGCFMYESALIGTPDFNRSAEGYWGWDEPCCIVTKKVKDCYEKNKLKGWAFEPVLYKGTDQYQKYESMWKMLYEKIAINPNIKLD